MKKAIIIVIGLLLILTVFMIKTPNKKQKHSNNLVVSILPLKYLVSKIIGDDYHIEVLTSQGTSPETYEPTPKQLVSLSDSSLVFTVGLIDFERELINKLSKQTDIKVVNLSEDVSLLSGSCGCQEDKDSHGHHHHGVDPHIWTSPKQLKIMASNAYRAISLLHSDNKYYEANLHALLTELDELDAQLRVCSLLQKRSISSYIIRQ